MSVDLIVLFAAIGLGAMLQVGIGIGFSIIVGPLLFLQIGTQAAVPLLLLLNVVVSVIAVPGTVRREDWPVIKSAAIACVIGILVGIAIYPLFSEAMVLTIAGGLLVIGAMSTMLPASAAGKRAFLPICGLSGLATVWAATPGPLMALGLILSDYPAAIVRKLVQPIALIGYSVAFALHALDGNAFHPMTLGFLGITVVGSFAGRWIGPNLPRQAITSGIRGISLLAGIVLIYRAVTLEG
jgi:uncharacterized membrane protein YfcA